MDREDALRAGLPAAVFVLCVSLALRYWPRPPPVFLTGERKQVEILDVRELSHDTKRLRLSLGSASAVLGLPVGKHLVVFVPNPAACLASGKWNGEDDPDRGRQELQRRYTPITGDETPGHVDLVVKVYRPGTAKMPGGKEATWQDGGKGSLYLDSKRPGDHIEIMGPVGAHEYLGRGTFRLPGRAVTVSAVGMIAGGTGITPMLQVARAALRDRSDTCVFRLLYANKTEDDILCRGLLEEMDSSSNGRFKVHYTLDFPPAAWAHRVGFVTKEMIRECLPAASASTLILVCGPPAMLELACKPSLQALGYRHGLVVAL